MLDDQSKALIAVVDFYFLEETGSRFKVPPSSPRSISPPDFVPLPTVSLLGDDPRRGAAGRDAFVQETRGYD
jgi:hypothetical protein